MGKGAYMEAFNNIDFLVENMEFNYTKQEVSYTLKKNEGKHLKGARISRKYAYIDAAINKFKRDRSF